MTLADNPMAAPSTLLTSDTASKIAYAILGAVLAVVGAYVLDRIKARREPRKQLTWELAVHQTLLTASSDIKKKVNINYNGTTVSDLAHLKCSVTNSGNRTIKGEQFRFTFPEGIHLLEHYLQPETDPELGVEFLDENGPDRRSQCRYQVAQLDRGERVIFNFVTAGGDLQDWRPRASNPEGDVDFRRRDQAVAKKDQDRIQPAIVLLFAAWFVPAAVEAIPLGLIGSDLAALLRIIFLCLLTPFIFPIGRVVERLVAEAIGRRDRKPIDARAWDGGTVLLFSDEAQSLGGIEIRSRDRDLEQ